MNSTKDQAAIVVLHDFFNNCINLQANQQLMDILITDSMIKEIQMNKDHSKGQVVGYLPAKDINFIFTDNKYRTFRTSVKHWDQTIKTLKKYGQAKTDLPKLLEGEENPLTKLLVPTGKGRIYGQPVVMQDIGLDFHNSVLFSGDALNNELEGLYDGDLNEIEVKFAKVGKLISEALRTVKANLNILGNDPDIKRDHVLYYSTFIDFENKQLAVSLTRLGYRMTNTDEDVEITPYPLNVNNWVDIFTSDLSKQVLNRLDKIFAGINIYLKQHFVDLDNKHPIKQQVIQELFSKLWPQLMQAAEPVYSFVIDDMTHELEAVQEEILTVVGNSCAKPGLDIPSWKVYDYTNPQNPQFVVDIGIEFYEKYRQEFMELVYQKLLYSGHTLLKPYGKKTVITDPEDLAQHAVGSIRTERF